MKVFHLRNTSLTTAALVALAAPSDLDANMTPVAVTGGLVQESPAAVTSQIQLGWPRGSLQQADDVGGPYFDIPGATSPYPATPSATRKFWRIRM